MSTIIIGSAPKAYRPHLSAADASGNNNGKIDSISEAVSVAKSFYKAHPTKYNKYHKLLMYLESNGYRLRPRLADEGTIPLKSVLTRPAGRKKTPFRTRASYSFDLTGNSSSHNFESGHDVAIDTCKTGQAVASMCLNYRQAPKGYAIPLYLYKHSSRRKREPAPVISGIGYKYTWLWKDISDVTHIEIDVKLMTTRRRPIAKGYLIIEIYDADTRRTSVRRSKNKRNRWLPKKNVDLFKVRIPISSTGKWQTLTVPLSKFIDWNRKRANCSIPEPGVNEDIGDGILNLKRRERFQIQVILEAESYDKRFGAFIGEYIRFVKFIK